MKHFLIISFICYLCSDHAQAQTPASQTFVFAGLPAAGFDYSRKVSRKKWSSSSLSVAASPSFYFKKYNFDFADGQSKFTHYRILVPVTLRFNLHLNQIILPAMGKARVKFGVFIDGGYCISYTLKAQLFEEFHSPSSDFIFDGNVASGSEKLSFHPTIGFGMNFGRLTILFRAFMKPYPWRDRSKDWELAKGQTSYFYSSEYTQPGVMICLGLRL